jgi:ankyrin repeat protein
MTQPRRLRNSFLPKPSHEELSVFFDGAIAGDEKAIKRFATRFPGSLNEPFYHHSFIGRTAIEWAAQKGDIATVALLIRLGADVNAPNSMGGNALAAAAGTGRKDIVQLLLDNGAMDSGLRHARGALAAAAGGAHDDIVALLLEHGAEPSAEALQQASFRGKLSTVQLLLDAGAPVSQEAVSNAAYQGSIDILRKLVDNGGKATTEALNSAAYSGSLEVVQFLIDNGASVNAPEGVASPLMSATMQGQQEIIRLLLKNGADIDARNEQGGTPLMYAVSSGQPGLVRLLLENGADKNLTSLQGQTPLEITRGHLKIFPDSQLLKDNAELLERWTPAPKTTAPRPPKVA